MHRWHISKVVFVILLPLFLGLLTYAIWPAAPDLTSLAVEAGKYDVYILRDTWGVPHIFGVTDADAAFGLAYAHAEDDFRTTQETLVAANAALASVYGRDSAPIDYMVHLLRIWDVVEARYETDLSLETRRLLEAYAEGLNHYAALHPDEVLLPELFPVDGKDIVAGSVLKSPLFFGLDSTIAELFADSRQHEVSSKALSWTGITDWLSPRDPGAGLVQQSIGSNTLAVSPVRSADGATFLAVNSHQPWQGAVTWYEAHVHSDEGWDAVGGLFPGSPVIIHGHNRALGWAFTVNYPDLADVYVLKINPQNPDQYLFDGEWLDLEKRQAPIRVRLFGKLRITVQQETLWSVYGPVVRQDHGVYALRYAGGGLVNIWEQLYRLNKATTFEEWRAAMKDGGLPNFNVGYADRDGNIFFLYNAMLPLRAEGYDWREYLPGDTSETLWTDYLSFEKLPQVLNPPSGFIQNANSAPFQTTLAPWNPSPLEYSATFGIDTQMTNRALRALELLGDDPEITFEEFIQYKYDWTYSQSSEMARFVRVIAEASFPADDRDLLAGQEILREWDLQMSPDSHGATLAAFTVYFLAQEGVSTGSLGPPIFTPAADEQIRSAFVSAVRYIVENQGSVATPWAQVNRIIRGDVDLGLGGGRDVLHAINGDLQDDGRIKGTKGDSYILLIRWDSNGQVKSFSIHQYGSATLDQSSPHYADQAPLFARRQLKPVWLDEAEIRANLEREYRPGEEIR